MENTVKIHAFLAHAGIAARRRCEDFVREGKVKINGVVVTNVATRIDPTKDEVEFAGHIVGGQPSQVVTLALYKPVGVVSTVSDPDNKPTVMEYIPEQYKELRLYPVGRLDEASEGLILLTNDGDLAYHHTHPAEEVEKKYLVTIGGHLTVAELRGLRVGVRLKDGLTRPTTSEVVETAETYQVIQMTLREGRNRQIRRMMEAMNHPVLQLKRIQIGEIKLDGLKPGQVRVITD
jgi:23S rRNA pseudouridine2605 synthase